MFVRNETPADYETVHEVNRLAFDQENEARLVEALRQPGKTISLVAEEGGRVVGHILFSPVTIETPRRPVPALALAPVAVLPALQNRGIGSVLIRQGLEECRQQGHRIVIVLGHARYYPRFGFTQARPLGIEPPFEVPDAAWMALELCPGALEGVRGVVRYPAAFDEV